jgi:hypothetical protein
VSDFFFPFFASSSCFSACLTLLALSAPQDSTSITRSSVLRFKPGCRERSHYFFFSLPLLLHSLSLLTMSFKASPYRYYLSFSVDTTAAEYEQRLVEAVQASTVLDWAEVEWIANYGVDWNDSDPDGEKQRRYLFLFVREVGRTIKELTLSNFKIKLKSFELALPCELFLCACSLAHADRASVS